MQITNDTLVEFKAITSKDIQAFFRKCIGFFTREYNIIVSYYNGTTSAIDSEVFKVFDDLSKECASVLETFQLHNRQLNNIKWWLVLESVEEIDSRLHTLAKINKWSRSSLTNVGYDPHISTEYILKQQQTLERVATDVVRSDRTDDWMQIAIDNSLAEEDYTSDGGVSLILKTERVNRNIKVDSVIDVMQGKSVYGKDLSKKLQFAENDLVVLNYDDTVKQSVEVLLQLRKNDNPDYPHEGLQSSIVIGSNRSMLNFPLITRQYMETFATDDSLKNFTITNLSVEADSLKINYSVQTRLDETIADQVTL